MSDKPAEILLFEFLSETADAAGVDDLLYQIDIHDTIYQSIDQKKPWGVRISDAVGEMAPGNGRAASEFDVDLTLVCFARVEGKNQKQRGEALQKVFDIQLAVCEAATGENK